MQNFKILTKEEQIMINGGSISGSLISSFIKGIEALFEIGVEFGSTIRRLNENAICPL